ncbi:hypothetical protein SDC9_157419 [bioreactor metagenome]|uniref:Uncharacterized protein n=1 Tax=bioreactor metagenome TaxID=1076179 RepID=A0A645F932_9ZZZZ
MQHALPVVGVHQLYEMVIELLLEFLFGISGQRINAIGNIIQRHVVVQPALEYDRGQAVVKQVQFVI